MTCFALSFFAASSVLANSEFSSMKAYIALTTPVATRANSELKLTSTMVNGSLRWLPLKETPEAAVMSAQEGVAASGLCAFEAITYHVLELNFLGDELLKFYESETIRKNSAAGGWYWHGPLFFQQFRPVWSQRRKDPMGLTSWAEMVLSKRYWPTSHNVCEVCGDAREEGIVTTWVSLERSWCAKCWHGYFRRQHTEDQQ